MIKFKFIKEFKILYFNNFTKKIKKNIQYKYIENKNKFKNFKLNINLNKLTYKTNNIIYLFPCIIFILVIFKFETSYFINIYKSSFEHFRLKSLNLFFFFFCIFFLFFYKFFYIKLNYL